MAGASWTQRLSAAVRSHRLFTAALAVATLLRLLVAIAYFPALEFYGDSPAYLQASQHPFRVDIWHPLGYPVLVWLASATRSLAVLTTLQHLLGLAAAVLVYRLVRRLGVGPVGGTLAAAPLLFDAYQLDVEHFVLSDTLFTFLLVAAVSVAARLLRDRTTGAAVGLGALLGAASLTRTVGLAVTVAVVVVLLLARTGWSRVAAVAATCAVPIGAYALAFHATYGVYGMQGFGGRYLYGIVAPFVHCDRESLPVEQRPLCPTVPTYGRPGFNQYVWAEYTAAHLPGNPIQRSRLAGDFARDVVSRQPGDVAGLMVGNLAHYFAPGRAAGPHDWFVGSWQFPLRDRSPAWNVWPAKYGFHAGDRVHGTVVTGLAEALRGYQRIFFTPGPALLLALLAAAAGCCLRGRDPTVRATTLMLALTGVALLVLPSASAGFDWRYVLPAQAVLVPAGVLAATLLRTPARRLLRRATPYAAALVAVAVTAPGLAAASVYPTSSLRPAQVVPVPATQSVGDAAVVRVGDATLIGTRCWQTEDGRRRLVGLVAFPAAVTSSSGARMLVQPGNFGVSNGELAFPGILPSGALLPSVVLSDRYPRAHGTVYAYVTSPVGTLRYVDPLGAGAAAWSFRLPAPPQQSPLGTPCTGATPWAGVQLQFLRVLRMPPFTQLDRQDVTYGLTHQSWRADSYDLRFRVASPTTAVGPWQYPKLWQRTTLTQQSLVNLSPGVTYCFSVRARDALGAVTDWSEPKCTARMYDDAVLPVSADWTQVTGRTGFAFGTYTATKAQDAAISVAGTFSRVALSAYRCPTCGVLDVFLGAQHIKTLDLSSTPAEAGLMQWTSRLLPSGLLTSQPATLTLKVRTRDRLVAIDAIGLLR